MGWRGDGVGVVVCGLLVGCPAGQVVTPEPRPPESRSPEAVVDRDPDRDGVVDGVDVCPGAAGEAPHGCPDLDVDRDGLLVMFDRCPGEPETRNGYEDGDGCPDEVPPPLPRFAGAIPTVYFRRGDAGVAGNELLRLTASYLLEYPELEVVISGHTDAREGGSTKGRRRLSLRRAEAVRDYLVGRGVARERLEVRGAGADEPVDVNTNGAGRATNRRVEFSKVTE